MLKTELIIYGDNCPVCPKCGNGNAMLNHFDQRHYVETDECRHTYYCRDCECEFPETECILVYMQLDKPGMGKNSTYTEIKRIEPKGEK